MDKQYLKENGDVDFEKFAPNDGKVPGTEITDQTLNKGTIIDRYGPSKGRYTSPDGTPYIERSLPYQENPVAYHRYEVIKPINGVSMAKIAPAFGQDGGGTQYLLPKTVRWLLKNGFLREIK